MLAVAVTGLVIGLGAGAAAGYQLGIWHAMVRLSNEERKDRMGKIRKRS